MKKQVCKDCYYAGFNKCDHVDETEYLKQGENGKKLKESISQLKTKVMEKECVKCKLRELTKGNQSSFIKNSVLRDAVKEVTRLIEYIETFQDEKNWSNDVWSIKVAAIKVKETLTKKQ